jgi:DNA-binding NtrC family response regulator
MGEKYSLLIVDDERDLIDQLYDYFRRYFAVHKAYDVEEAINIFNENEIHLVMTDQRLPGIQGTELLAAFKEKKPEVTRVLMTGYTEIEVAINVINYGSIHRYLQKPLDLDKLAGTIEEGLRI